MTQLPDALEMPEPPPPRTRWLSVTISWLVIIICVVLMVQREPTVPHAKAGKAVGPAASRPAILPVVPGKSSESAAVKRSSTTSPSTQPVKFPGSPEFPGFTKSLEPDAAESSDATEPDDAEDLEGATERISQIILGRYVVGAKAFLTAFEPHNAAQHDAKFQTSIDSQIKTPMGRIRAAILAGELLGGPEAARRLSGVARDETLPEDVRRTARALRPIYLGPRPNSRYAEWRVVKDWGWFGNLALSFGQPDSDPQRELMTSAALRTFVTMLVVVLIAMALFIAGLGLLILVLVLWLMKRWQGRFARTGPLVESRAIEAVAAWFALFLIVSYAARYVMQNNWGDYRLVAYVLLLIAPFLPLVRGVPWPRWRRAIGWHSGTGISREAAAGLLGYIAGVPLLAVGVGMTMIISKLTDAHPTHPIVFEILGDRDGRWWGVIELFVLAAVWAPLLEETIFRGALYQHLRGWSAPVVAALINGFIFAVIHPQGFAGIPPIMALGFTFAMIREWRGSLIGPMIAHAINNATAMTVLLLVLR